MQKVLIISYFFPPYNVTGSFRIYSWAKHLNTYGIYPIVVTRNWNNVNSILDASKTIATETRHEKNEHFEVYYLPYKGNLRDKILVKFGENKFVYLRKFLTFCEIILQNYFTSVIPFKNIYHFAKQLIEKDKEIKGIITSGKPFILFKFCYLLKKQYGINWIADYRDDWSTSQYNTSLNPIEKLIKKIEAKSEKKWLSNSFAFTTISEHYVDVISAFIKKQGYLLSNGFDEADFEREQIIPFKEFTITFNGTLYPTQPVEDFLQAFKNVANQLKYPIKLIFLGLGIDDNQKKRVENQIKGFEKYIEITERIDRKKAIEILMQSHLFLMLSHNNIKGVTSSKIFDYMACKKPVLLYPSDKEVLEKILKDTGVGLICNNIEEIETTLLKAAEEFYNAKEVEVKLDYSKIDGFSRKLQTKVLSDIINTAGFNQVPEKKTQKDSLKEILSERSCQLNFNKVLYNINKIKPAVTILCFHEVSDNFNIAYPPLKVSVFKEIIQYIDKNYTVISLSDINRIKSKKPLLVITFDDGYKNFLDYALPILYKHKMPAVQNIIVQCAESELTIWTQRLNNILNHLFLKCEAFSCSFENSSFAYKNQSQFHNFNHKLFQFLLKKNAVTRKQILDELEKKLQSFNPIVNKMMDWNDIKSCMSYNIEIGSHTLSHDCLTTIEDKDILKKELFNSKSIIEKQLDTVINTIAFPNGQYNKDVIQFCKDSGYNNLLSTEEKFYYFYKNNGIKPDILPRISLYHKTIAENILKIHNFHNLFRF